MDVFARCFLLVFAQLYVGGLLSLSIPPFHEIERGFYKSSAAVYAGAGLLAFAGRLALVFNTPGNLQAQAVELVLWLVSLLAGGLYLSTLWSDDVVRRARSFVAAWSTGLGALLLNAESFRLSPLFSAETLLYPVTFIASALLLGAVTTGMLLGHWYLIDRALTLDPFRRILRFYVTMLVVEAALLLLNGTVIALIGAAASVDSLTTLLQQHTTLVIVRVLLSPLSAAVLAWMIWKTLQIPQTMAATGLFYIAILSVLVGAFMSRFILFRTSLPL